MDTTDNQIIIDKLKGVGMHVTKTRIYVLKMLIEKNFALSVFDINVFSGGTLDRVSVYRTFQEFLQRGIVKKIPNSNGEIKYLLQPNAGNTPVEKNKPVAYLCCTDCGVVEEIGDIRIPVIKLPVHLNIQRSQLLIEGICKRCLHH